MMELVYFNYEVNNLVECYDTVKIDAVVSVEKLKKNMVMLKTSVVKIMIFLVLKIFISNMSELNYGALDEV